MSLSNTFTVLPEEQRIIPIPTLAYEFVAADLSGELRGQLEHFVQEGFLTSYNAQVTTFMPLLLGIQAPHLRAVVGVRRASQPLFIEQYLPLPITDMLKKHGVWTQRHAIAELGNLYSKNQRFTLPLLMTVVMSLYLCDVNYLVFAGTSKVRQLLDKLKLPLTFLCDATSDKLEDEGSWGSYYDNNPKVMFIDVQKAVTIALMQPELAALFELVKTNLQPLLHKMRTL